MKTKLHTCTVYPGNEQQSPAYSYHRKWEAITSLFI